MTTSSALMPPERTQTTTPFVQVQLDLAGDDDDAAKWRPHATKTITVESTSEIVDYWFPGSQFSSTEPLELIHDAAGQPLAFTIGADHVLHMIAHITGESHGWRDFSLRPDPQFTGSVFHVESDGRTAFLAVAGTMTTTKATAIYHTSFSLDMFSGGSQGKVTTDTIDLQWTCATADWNTHRAVTTIRCGRLSSQGLDSAFQIIATAAASDQAEASPYMLSSKSPLSWTMMPLPLSAEKVLVCVPAHLPQPLADGHFLIVEGEGADKPLSCVFQGDGVAKRIYLQGLGRPTTIITSRNYHGYDDLLVATDNGIGHFEHNKLGQPPTIICSGTSFRALFCSESADREKGQSELALCALSAHNELFCFYGTRDAVSLPRPPVSWIQSQLPIKTGVKHIGSHHNGSSGACELVYVTYQDDVVRHLLRDPVSSMWKEMELMTASPNGGPPKRTRAPAAVSTVRLHDGADTPAPRGFAVYIESEPTLAQINGQTYYLDSRPQKVLLGENGQIKIAIALQDGISAADITVSLQESGVKPSEKHVIHPVARAFKTFESIKSGADIKNAVTTDGRPLFTTEKANSLSSTDLDQAASMLKQLPHAVKNLGQGGTRQLVAEDIELCWSKDENGKAQRTDKSSFLDALDAAGNFLGDVFAYIKNGVKSIVKFALKIVGPVISFIIRIGAKVIRFVLNTARKVLEGVAVLLEAVGLDMSGLRDWISFHFLKAANMQKDLASMVDNTIQLARGFLASNNDLFSKLLEKIEPQIGQFVPKPPSGPQKSAGSSAGSTILRLLNNPIISILLDLNPMTWIAEAVLEEAGESIKYPSMSLDDGSSFFESMGRVLVKVWDALQDLMGDVSSVMSDPSSLVDKIMARLQGFIWMLFDELKKIGTDIATFLVKGLDALTKFLKDEWEIPLLTDVWEDLTGCKFSVLDFFTYVAAQLMSLLNIGFDFVKEALKGLAVIQAAATASASRNLVNTVRFDSRPAWQQASFSHMEKSAAVNSWAVERSSAIYSNTAQGIPEHQKMMATSTMKVQTRMLQAVPDNTEASDQPPPYIMFQQQDHQESNDKPESSDQPGTSPSKDEPTEHESGSPSEHEHEEPSESTIIVITTFRVGAAACRLLGLLVEACMPVHAPGAVGQEGRDPRHQRPGGALEYLALGASLGVFGCRLAEFITLLVVPIREAQNLPCRVINMVFSGAAFLAARRGRKEDIAQANFVSNLVSAVTAYWLEEGPARWFEMSGSACAVIASMLFAKGGKARVALGAIMSAGDLAGCIGVLSYTAADLRKVIKEGKEGKESGESKE